MFFSENAYVLPVFQLAQAQKIMYTGAYALLNGNVVVTEINLIKIECTDLFTVVAFVPTQPSTNNHQLTTNIWQTIINTEQKISSFWRA